MTIRREGPTTKAEIDKLHVSVATFSIDDPLDLSLELTLTKAAVLYADHVTLLGPKVVFLSYVDELARGSRRDRDHILMRMWNELPQGVLLLRQLDEFAMQSPRLGSAARATVRALGLAWLRFAIPRAIKPLEAQAAYSEFKRAVKAGVLTLDPLTEDGGPPRIEAVAEQMASTITAAMRDSQRESDDAKENNPVLEVFKVRLLALLDPASPSEPLFDANVRPIVEGLSYFAQRVGVPVLKPSTETAIAKEFIGSVPTFPDAPMGEILDARRALRHALPRFRSAVIVFSQELTALPGDANFEREASVLYRRDVAPAIEELKEIEHDLRLDRELVRHGLAATKEITAGVLALTALQQLDVDAAAKALAALAPAAGRIGHGILEDRRAANVNRRQNRFVFLHELKRRLGRD